MISKPGFNLGTNLKVNLDDEKDKQDVKSNEEHKQDTKPNIKLNEGHEQDTKHNVKFNKECKQDVKKPDTNKITYEEEKVGLALGMTTIFTVWWMFK